eukprot:420084_1
MAPTDLRSHKKQISTLFSRQVAQKANFNFYYQHSFFSKNFVVIMAFVSNEYVTNRLISLLSKVGELNRPTLYSQVDYQSVERLILTSSSLLSIIRHPVFKQSTNKLYHETIYSSIISYADIYEKELYGVILELD